MIDAVRSREIFERQMNQRWSPSRHMLEEGGQGFCRFCDSRPLLLTVRGYYLRARVRIYLECPVSLVSGTTSHCDTVLRGPLLMRAAMTAAMTAATTAGQVTAGDSW